MTSIKFDFIYLPIAKILLRYIIHMLKDLKFYLLYSIIFGLIAFITNLFWPQYNVAFFSDYPKIREPQFDLTKDKLSNELNIFIKEK